MDAATKIKDFHQAKQDNDNQLQQIKMYNLDIADFIDQVINKLEFLTMMIDSVDVEHFRATVSGFSGFCSIIDGSIDDLVNVKEMMRC